MATILVTDTHLDAARAVVRSLGRRGHRVVAAEWEDQPPAVPSRHAVARVRHPSPVRNAAGAIEVLMAAAAEHRAQLVVPVSGELAFPLGDARRRLPQGTALALPSNSALAVTRDRRAVLALARRLGVPAQEDERAGVAMFGVELLMRAGRPLAVFQQRRVSPRNGARAVCETVPVDLAMYRHAARVLNELAWTGLATVEFCDAGDEPRLTGIEAGVPRSLPLAVRAGMDLPARMADVFLDLIQGPQGGPPDVRYELGLRSPLRLDVPARVLTRS